MDTVTNGVYMSTSTEINTFWNSTTQTLTEQLGSSAAGLSAVEADARLHRRGALKERSDFQVIGLFFNQFTNPLVLLLLFAAALSFFLADRSDAIVIMAIVGISGCLGFWQEWGAHDAVKKMLAIVQIKTNVIRDGQVKEVTIRSSMHW